MANMSTAYGTVKITAKDEKDLRNLLKLQELAELSSYYETTLENPVFTTENDQATVTCDVFGSGRWSFQSNIEWFFDNTFELKENDASIREKQKKLNIEELQKKTFTATFEIIEEEFGMAFIAEIDETMRWENNKSETISLNITTHELTATNLIQYCSYDTWSYVDVEYALNNFDDAVEYMHDIASDTNDEDRLKIINAIDKYPDLTKQYLVRHAEHLYITDNIFELFDLSFLKPKKSKEIADEFKLITFIQKYKTV